MFLCSPNNPTGNRFEREAIVALAQDLQGRALVVVDEAYVEFAAAPSLTAQLEALPGLVLLRTLSKAHGLAGARCGALIAHADVVALLRKVIQPYAVTQLTIEAVFRALEPGALAEARAHAATILAERARLADGPQRPPRGAARVAERSELPAGGIRRCAQSIAGTHAAGVLVRDLRAALRPCEALRISIGSPQQNDRLLASLA